MRTSILAFTILALAVVATGCDKSGIHPLARKRDVVGECTTPTSTWMRSWMETTTTGTDVATDVLLIGSTTPTAATSSKQCFVRATVSRDSRTLLDFGTYELTAQGSGTFTYAAHYKFFPEPAKKILERTGAVRTDLDPPTTETLEIVDGGDGKTILVSFNGTQHRYTNLLDVAKKIDPSTPAGARDAYRLYNLPLFTSQVRVGGFGSSGMTQYIPSPGVFEGLVANSFSVSVDGYANPTAHIIYDQFQELTGIEISGEQVTESDTSGNGPMRGVLDWVVSDPATRAIVLSGTVDYANLRVGNGVAASGSYTIAINGHGSYVLDYTIATDEDFRDILPVTTP